jgi:hypothetical protein
MVRTPRNLEKRPLVERIRLALTLLFAAGWLALAPAAGATTQTVNDARGDGKSDVDIKKVTVVDRNGTITATITTWKSLVNAGTPCLWVRGGAHATTRDYWSVGCFGPKHRTANAGRTTKPIAGRQTKFTMTYTFAAKALGIGASFQWRAVQLEETPAEAAPDRSWAKHVMDRSAP